jgi:glycosyltransferase involved in cell wall biosynthesis
MRIAQVNPGCGIPVPPPSWGAIEKIVWEFMCNLRELGHEVDLMWSRDLVPGDYDIVHCHVANLAIQLAQQGVPYIYQLHDHHAYHYGKDSHVFRENMKAIEGSLVSLVPARFLVDYFDHPKVKYFAHGVNTDEFYNNPFHSKPEKPKLLMVANNGLAGDPTFDRKGFTYGLGLAMMNDLEITIAGPSANKQFFNGHLWMLNYPKLNLVFDTPNTKLLELYHNHDIFVHPTMLEAGHPNLTMIEAAAAGLPIIANWEYETDFHGAWRAPRDVFEMDRGLKDIMINWDSYKNQAINTGKELSWYNRSKEIVKIYETFN